MWKKGAAFLCLIAAGCLGGCISYDQVVFKVTDDRTHKPVANAFVALQWQSVMMRINAAEIARHQSGYTNESGEWVSTQPTNLHGVVFVSKPGFLDKKLTIAPDDLRDDRQEIALVADRDKTDAAARTGAPDVAVTDHPATALRQALVVNLNDPAEAAAHLFDDEARDATRIERGGERSSRIPIAIRIDDRTLQLDAWRFWAGRDEQGGLSALGINLAPTGPDLAVEQVRTILRNLGIEDDLPDRFARTQIRSAPEVRGDHSTRDHRTASGNLVLVAIMPHLRPDGNFVAETPWTVYLLWSTAQNPNDG